MIGQPPRVPFHADEHSTGEMQYQIRLLSQVLLDDAERSSGAGATSVPNGPGRPGFGEAGSGLSKFSGPCLAWQRPPIGHISLFPGGLYGPGSAAKIHGKFPNYILNI